MLSKKIAHKFILKQEFDLSKIQEIKFANKFKSDKCFGSKWPVSQR
jgi:hypothetical protein